MISKSKPEELVFERSNSEPRGSTATENQLIEETKAALVSRADQLKRAREDFFLGKESSPSQTENSPRYYRFEFSALFFCLKKGSFIQVSWCIVYTVYQAY